MDPPKKKVHHLHLLPRHFEAATRRLRSQMHLHQMVMQHAEKKKDHSGKDRRM